MVLRSSTCNQIVSINHQWHLKCLPVVLSFSFLFTFNLTFWPFKVFKHLKWHSLIFLRYYQVLILYDNQFYPYNTNIEMKNDIFDGLVIFQSGISFPIRITFNFYPTQNLYSHACTDASSFTAVSRLALSLWFRKSALSWLFRVTISGWRMA